MKKIQSLKTIMAIALAFAVLVGFASCSGSDDEPESIKGVNLTQTEYEIIAYTKSPIQGVGVSDLQWQSDNEFVATVSNGVIEAGQVGEATITVINSRGTNNKIHVKVKGKTTPPFTEPCTKIGVATVDDVISIFGTPTAKEKPSENTISLRYKFSDKDEQLYLFEDNVLTNVVIGYDEYWTERIGDYLRERSTTALYEDTRYPEYQTFKGTKANPIPDITAFVWKSNLAQHNVTIIYQKLKYPE